MLALAASVLRVIWDIDEALGAQLVLLLQDPLFAALGHATLRAPTRLERLFCRLQGGRCITVHKESKRAEKIGERTAAPSCPLRPFFCLCRDATATERRSSSSSLPFSPRACGV